MSLQWCCLCFHLAFWFLHYPLTSRSSCSAHISFYNAASTVLSLVCIESLTLASAYSAQSLWKQLATTYSISLLLCGRIFTRDPWTSRLKYALQNIDVKCPGDADFGFGNLVEKPRLQAHTEWQLLVLNKLNTAKGPGTFSPPNSYRLVFWEEHILLEHIWMFTVHFYMRSWWQ